MESLNTLERPAPRPFYGDLVLVFASNTETLNGEDLLEAAGLDFELIPVPKSLNPNCGLALSFQEKEAPAAWSALGGLVPKDVYMRQGDEYIAMEGAAALYSGLTEPKAAEPAVAGPVLAASPAGLKIGPGDKALSYVKNVKNAKDVTDPQDAPNNSTAGQ